MINLETPRKFDTLIGQAHQVAVNVLRPNSRKYDTAEHEYPKELDMLAALIDGMSEGGGMAGAGVGTVGSGPSSNSGAADLGNRNGSNMASLLGLIEMWKLAPKILEAKQMAGVPNAAVQHPALYLLFSIFFLPSDLNEIWQAAGGGQPR